MSTHLFSRYKVTKQTQTALQGRAKEQEHSAACSKCIAMTSYSPAYLKISAVMDRLEQNQILYKAGNFIERMKAIDVLDLHMLDDIAHVNHIQMTDAEKSKLSQRAEALKQKLTAANEEFCTYLLHSIRANDRATVKQYFKEAEQQIANRVDDDNLGYDEIDMLVNDLFEVAFVPSESKEREAGMMYYQPTPARIILKLINHLPMSANDTFYDLGSGLGHVPILVNLLTDIKTRGVELDGSYARYSDECLKKLGLSNVEFITADARHVDYYDGTIFYMYTPFQGEILRQVLHKLETQSKGRHIKICTYGHCTLQVAKQKWLQPTYQAGEQEGSLAIFANQSP